MKRTLAPNVYFDLWFDLKPLRPGERPGAPKGRHDVEFYSFMYCGTRNDVDWTAMIRATIETPNLEAGARRLEKVLGDQGWVIDRMIPDLIKWYAISDYGHLGLDPETMEKWFWGDAAPVPLPPGADNYGKWFVGDIRQWLRAIGKPPRGPKNLFFPTQEEHDAVTAVMGWSDGVIVV
jgi:hypothetical protein